MREPTILDLITHVIMTCLAFSSYGTIAGFLYLFLGYIISYYVASLIGMAIGFILMILSK